MGTLFSRHGHHSPHHKKPPHHAVKVTDHDRAVLDLKVAKDRLKRYQGKMRSESTRLTEQAKELVTAGRKDRALLVLKMRRLREEEQAKAETQLLNVETLITQIEWETEQLRVFDALKSGNQALEAIHQIMSLEEVEKLMADTADSIEYEQEISRILSGNLSAGAEEDVLKEFEALQAELAPPAPVPAPVPAPATEEEEEVAEAPVTNVEEAAKPAPAAVLPELPEVPTHAPVVKKTGKEQEEEEEEEATPTAATKKTKVAVTG